MTLHEDAMEQAAMDAVRKDPSGWGARLSNTIVKLTDGYYDKTMRDVIFQHHWRTKITLDVAYAFTIIHEAIFDGDVVFARIPVGAVPSSDRSTKENNNSLQKISGPFKANFYGGPGDQDGSLSWSVPIEAVSAASQKLATVVVPPRSAPLEVGTTKASRTWLHLAQERCIARWPYGLDRIVLLVVVNEKLWRSQL